LPVDQGYSWVFMGLCCTLSAFSWGVNSGYSVFLAYYLSNDLFENATDMDFAFIGGFSFTMGFILSPLITIVMGKLGLKNSIFLGICCQSGGLIAASFAKKVWHLYLTQGILQGIGLAFMIMPINIITSHWFHRKKSLANGVIAAGSGLGGIIFSLSGQALLVSLGLAWALRIIGIITFSVNVICLTFIRHRGKEIPINYNSFSRSSLKILKRPHIFFFYAWSAPSMMAYCILLYSLSAYSVAMGFTHFQGAIVGSLLQVSSAVGRPLLGLFMDRVGCVNASVLVGFYCATIIFAIWIPATNLPLIYVFALLIGGPSSVVSVGVQPIGQDMASLDELPTLYAVVWTINGIFAVFSEVIGLKVRKLEWKYSFVFTQLFSGLAYLFGALLML
ncbi:major facilitator superfamily protein, partial [Nadsonia fulvescens var. elongata DSM 6958]